MHFIYCMNRLEKMGALEVDKMVHRHQAWRLISCIWLHAWLIHLLANMLSLVYIGIRLEHEFGFVISVGASGALFGLLGGMLSELLTNWTIYANKSTQIGNQLNMTCLSNGRSDVYSLSSSSSSQVQRLCSQLCS